jgi:hypothetical protein
MRALLGLLFVAGCARAPAPSPVLYAWDRPEQLAALAGADVAVAVYTATVSLRAGDVVWRPRAHALTLPPGARRIAVVHVEPAAPATRRPLDDGLRAFLVEKLVAVAHAPDVAELQLDYEAPRSERDFLRALVGDLRRALGPTARLSMTALASWCLFDDWVRDLPVDAVVPMVYRMGHDRAFVRRWLDEGNDFRVARCRQAVALSLADAPPRLPAGRRHFLFNPRSWTPADLTAALSWRIP